MTARRSLLLLAGVLLLLLPATPASAHISAFSIDYGSYHDVPGGVEWDALNGDITCTEGERYLVTAKVLDSPSYKGKGRQIGTCTGSSQRWRVELTDEQGVGDARCPMRHAATAHTKVDGTGHDKATDVVRFFSC